MGSQTPIEREYSIMETRMHIPLRDEYKGMRAESVDQPVNSASSEHDLPSNFLRVSMETLKTDNHATGESIQCENRVPGLFRRTAVQTTLPCTYNGVCHTRPGAVFKRDCSTTKSVQTSKDSSSESSSRDVPNTDLCGTDTIPTAGMSSMENRPRGL